MNKSQLQKNRIEKNKTTKIKSEEITFHRNMNKLLWIIINFVATFAIVYYRTMSYSNKFDVIILLYGILFLELSFEWMILFDDFNRLEIFDFIFFTLSHLGIPFFFCNLPIFQSTITITLSSLSKSLGPILILACGCSVFGFLFQAFECKDFKIKIVYYFLAIFDPLSKSLIVDYMFSRYDIFWSFVVLLLLFLLSFDLVLILIKLEGKWTCFKDVDTSGYIFGLCIAFFYGMVEYILILFAIANLRLTLLGILICAIGAFLLLYEKTILKFLWIISIFGFLIIVFLDLYLNRHILY